MFLGIPDRFIHQHRCHSVVLHPWVNGQVNNVQTFCLMKLLCPARIQIVTAFDKIIKGMKRRILLDQIQIILQGSLRFCQQKMKQIGISVSYSGSCAKQMFKSSSNLGKSSFFTRYNLSLSIFFSGFPRHLSYCFCIESAKFSFTVRYISSKVTSVILYCFSIAFSIAATSAL